MKILGLSFGRNMKNCEILVKKALIAAEEEGADVSFVRMIDKTIGHCKGCGACSAGMRNGKDIVCILKDDYEEVVQELLSADGVIIAAPVYSLGITGQFKNFLDRFSAAHDRASLTIENEKRKQEGKTLLDERVFKDRYIGYISVGGASTQNWVSLGLPMMHLFDFSSQMKVVDQIDAFDMGRTGNPLLDQKLMQRVTSLGKNIVQAIAHKDASWKGQEGTCPVCHCNLLTFHGTTDVECPICGIHGSMKMEGDKVSVEFSEKEQNRARNTKNGLQEHYDEIHSMPGIAIPKITAAKETLDKQMEELKQYLI